MMNLSYYAKRGTLSARITSHINGAGSCSTIFLAIIGSLADSLSGYLNLLVATGARYVLRHRCWIVAGVTFSILLFKRQVRMLHCGRVCLFIS